MHGCTNVVTSSFTDLILMCSVLIMLLIIFCNRWRFWLRHCATNPVVAGSIPDGVIGIFLLTSFRQHYGPGFDSASNRNDFLGGKGGRCVGLTILPPSYADCHEIWEPQPPGALRDCPGLYM